MISEAGVFIREMSFGSIEDDIALELLPWQLMWRSMVQGICSISVLKYDREEEINFELCIKKSLCMELRKVARLTSAG